jgi:AraC-like DNA-binding protein
MERFYGLHPRDVVLDISQKPYPQEQDEQWSIKGATYVDYDLFICTGGSAAFSQSGETHILYEGDAFLAMKGEKLQAGLAEEPIFKAVAQHFTAHYLSEIDMFSLLRIRQKVHFSNWEELRSILEKYVYYRCNDDRDAEAYGFFHFILFSFLREACIEKAGNISESYQCVLEMARILESQASEQHALQTALRSSHYSRDYTNELFKRFFRVPPKQYLISLRLKMAKEYLRIGKSVKESALSSGFNDELYFSRLFRRRTGISPSEYAKISSEERES